MATTFWRTACTSSGRNPLSSRRNRASRIRGMTDPPAADTARTSSSRAMTSPWAYPLDAVRRPRRPPPAAAGESAMDLDFHRSLTRRVHHGGMALSLAAARGTELVDSRPIVGDYEALRARIRQDGYVFVRG